MNRSIKVIIFLASLQQTAFVFADGNALFEFDDVSFLSMTEVDDVVLYYPANQGISEQWTVRASVKRIPDINADRLDDAVDYIISSYPENAVTVIRNYPIEVVEGHDEHFLVLVSKGESFLELSAHRILMVNEQVLVFSYSRREYGTGVGPTLSRWMQENGEALETALLAKSVESIDQAL